MKKLILSASLILLAAGPLFAQDDEKEIVITATRTHSGRTGGVSSSVLNNKELTATSQVQVEEVLKMIPGVEISSNGGPGGQTSIYLRGADAKNTLVLVDGIMVNDPTHSNRGANLADLTLENIERIEVIKGPQSVLYGSNAASGVVNIITKKGKKPESYAGAEAGSYGTTRVFAGTAGKEDRLDYSAAVSSLKTDGFSTADNRNSKIPQDGNTSEKDGWTNRTLSLSLGYQLGEASEVRLNVRDVVSDVKLDGTGSGYIGDQFAGYPPVAQPNGDKKQHQGNRETLAGLTVKNRLGDLDSLLGVKSNQTSHQLYDETNSKTNDFAGTSQEFSWQGGLELGTQELTLGLAQSSEALQQNSYSAGVGTLDVDKKASTQSLWLQDQVFGFDEALELILGVRNDNHDRFGSKSTYRVAPAWKFADLGLKLKASQGTGFRSPSLYELFGTYTVFGSTQTIGNQDLKPESSTGWDLGAEKQLGDWSLSVTQFQMDFTDRIEYVYNTTTYAGAYANQTGKTTTSGTEVELTGKPRADLTLKALANLTKTKDPNGDPLVRRPEQSYKGSGDWQAGEGLGLYLEAQYVGKRTDIPSAQDKDGNAVAYLDAYNLANLAVNCKLTATLEAYGRIDNLTDTYYEEAWSYATPGRSYLVGLKAKF